VGNAIFINLHQKQCIKENTMLYREILSHNLIGVAFDGRQGGEELSPPLSTQMQQQNDSQDEEQSPPAKETILVVDDNPDQLNLLMTILSIAGYQVSSVPNGKLALSTVESTLPDLILLDIMMPQMDGYEVCTQLKASSRTQNIPVIFMSALHEALDKVKAFEVGGVDYITKPFQMEEVVARVENQLRIHRLSKQLLAQNARLSEEICIRKRVEQALQESVERERAIAIAIQRMRQTLDIQTIFTATTHELRQLINCDRVAVYRFHPDWSGEFVCEAVGSEWISLVKEQTHNPNLTQNALENKYCTVTSFDSEADEGSALGDATFVQDTYLQETQGGAYNRGASHTAVADIYKAGFNSCYINLLERFQARAYIIVPIFLGSKLWGLLAAYQNSGSRSWKTTEINVVLEIGNQLGVAIQQAELFAQTQRQSEALRQSEARFREKAEQLELTLEELKRTQTQLIQNEKMSSLGQMVAGVAHEINNPVSFIYGNLTPARDYFQDVLRLIEVYQQTYPDSTPEIQQVVEEIDLNFLVNDWQKLMDSMQMGAERIKEIVRSLLLFSRQNESELKPVDIHESIDSTLLILQHRLRAKGDRPGIKVIKDYAQLPLVTCYASQLNQVFMNLLSNAIDAIASRFANDALEQESGVRSQASAARQSARRTSEPRTESGVRSQELDVLPMITIRTEVSNQNNSLNSDNCILNSSTVVIHIADNGIGMTEEVRQKIFDPFFTTKPVGNGTGLGLSISYQIVVENHNGNISCVSTPGQGAEFIVEIPVNCEGNSK
jgi:signal transduction histidine kinase/DNA-binding response OmpR family regulator